ncbi:hypothetical protein Dbac_0216 [Desulfomicrobium baculatum DSM 4028]|uniref:Lipoprotein n=2 Tax=Desulfomicrobium baculatum TaxID=899 RepID=C7LTQ8_DESBD|nr:hypothetical protein Dbac_0216 [Desulfomicrobium baculatum DSM 4028]
MRIKISNPLCPIKLFLVAVIIASSAGCAKFTKYEYVSHVFPLDDGNELVISTFASGYPNIKSRISFLYKELYAPQSVYFQFFVREAGVTGGRNPNIESILVRNFSYEFPGQASVVLIQDYPDGFWQQGQRDYDSENLEPVPCVDGWHVRVKFDLVLNGRAFKGEHILYAREVSKVYPLIFDALR